MDYKLRSDYLPYDEWQAQMQRLMLGLSGWIQFCPDGRVRKALEAAYQEMRQTMREHEAREFLKSREP